MSAGILRHLERRAGRRMHRNATRQAWSACRAIVKPAVGATPHACLTRRAVDRVADDRPAFRREVDADLVRAPGDQAAPHAARRAASAERDVRQPLEARDARLAAAIAHHDTPAIPRIAIEREVDRALAPAACPRRSPDSPSRSRCSHRHAAAPRAPPRSWRRARGRTCPCRAG